MNPITDLIFTATWFALLVWAVRSIVKGWTSQSVRDYNAGTWTTQVTKRIHPEMEDVEVGDELLIVRFDEPKREMDPRFKLDSPELHNLGDPLHRSLQDRIDELNDDDDDEGGLIVRR